MLEIIEHKMLRIAERTKRGLNMAKICYLRVSTAEQNLASQELALEKFAPFDRTFTEKQSGMDQNRPVLAECLRFLRDGDELYVTRADRLARSTSHLLKIVEDLKGRGVDVVFTEQPELSTGSAQGKLMLSILAAIAEFEHALRAARQTEGILAAKRRGVVFGAPKKTTPDMVALVKRLRSEGMGIEDIQRNTGLKSRSTVYRCLNAT